MQPTRRKRPIRPAVIAPLIPVWGLLGFFGVQQLGGTRWFAPFLAFMALIFIALFTFIARQTLTTRKLRKATRKLGN